MTTPLKLNLKTKSPCSCFDNEKLKYLRMQNFFQTYVRLKFAALNLLDTEKDTLAFDIREVLLNRRRGAGKTTEENSTMDHRRSPEFVRQ